MVAAPTFIVGLLPRGWDRSEEGLFTEGRSESLFIMY
jgi:hypothetical protein